jgi:hypothetical protein
MPATTPPDATDPKLETPLKRPLFEDDDATVSEERTKIDPHKPASFDADDDRTEVSAPKR